MIGGSGSGEQIACNKVNGVRARVSGLEWPFFLVATTTLGSVIVNFGSISWHLGQGGMPAYTTAKAAVEGLTRGMARDLGPDNIRVNCVIPGWVMTERQVTLWLTPEAEAELMQRQCIKQKLMPHHVASMVLFLAAEDSAMCTNQSYIGDGGWV